MTITCGSDDVRYDVSSSTVVGYTGSASPPPMTPEAKPGAVPVTTDEDALGLWRAPAPPGWVAAAAAAAGEKRASAAASAAQGETGAITAGERAPGASAKERRGETKDWLAGLEELNGAS